MSGLQLIIPLDNLPEDTELTTQGILALLTDAEKHRGQANFYKETYNNLVTAVQSAGRNLTLILEDVDEWHRVQALRNFATEMTTMGNSVRQMP